MQAANTFGRRGAQPVPVFAPPVAAAPVSVADLSSETAQQNTLSRRLPWLTLTILAVLAAAYGLETWVSAAGGYPGRVSHLALLKLGGVSRDLVVGRGDYWRLLTVSLLHQNPAHLIGNAVALLLVGVLLEPIVGRGWFALIYVISGVAGALGSLAMNAPQVLSVGASGAIMGMACCSLVLSVHGASFEHARRMQMLSLRVMIPALLPLSGHVDYSAHIGGAVAGAMLGFLLQIIWSEVRARPPRALAAGALACAAAAAGALALLLAAASPAAAPSGTPGLIPIDDLPTDTAGWTAQAAGLAARYPADPRAHLFKGFALAKARDDADAESEYRLALQSPLLTAPEMPPATATAIRSALVALYLGEQRMSAAKAAAAPLCADPGSVNRRMMTLLRSTNLCGPT